MLFSGPLIYVYRVLEPNGEVEQILMIGLVCGNLYMKLFRGVLLLFSILPCTILVYVITCIIIIIVCALNFVICKLLLSLETNLKNHHTLNEKSCYLKMVHVKYRSL